jgi:hypothetical protein
MNWNNSSTNVITNSRQRLEHLFTSNNSNGRHTYTHTTFIKPILFNILHMFQIVTTSMYIANIYMTVTVCVTTLSPSPR